MVPSGFRVGCELGCKFMYRISVATLRNVWRLCKVWDVVGLDCCAWIYNFMFIDFD